MKPPEGTRVDVAGVTLVWGDATRWKAALRDESLRAHLELPVGERLLRAVAMLVPARGAHERAR